MEVDGQIRAIKGLALMWLIMVVVVLDLSWNGRSSANNHESSAGRSEASPGVTLLVTNKFAVLDNGIIQVSLANPEGYVTGVRFNDLDNLLEIDNEDFNRGYWDVVWSGNGWDGVTDRLYGSHFEVVTENEDMVEISFSTTWDSASWTTTPDKMPRVPLNVDRRYIMLRGRSGFYSYAILEREEGWPQVHMDQIRAVFKLHKNKFHYMAVSDDRQRIMPMPQDRDTGVPLAYKEAVLLTNPTDPDLRGEVDDKYQYSCEDRENKVHGWISFEPSIGFWMITPSNEFRSGGPIKQDLTSHTGPITLAMFQSTHYAGIEATMAFDHGEPWKKVFGPFFVYLNSASREEDPYVLWEDAKHQMVEEVRSWPYAFPMSNAYPKAQERGSVMGRLFLLDRFGRYTVVPARHAWVGLATPGEVGSWQTESKGYQFWSRADHNGNFLIEGIHEGNYSLYGWVRGHIGDYKYEFDISVTPGRQIGLGNIVYKPLRNGPTLWEIGIPDRTAAEFYIPDPNQLLLNKLYVTSSRNKFRQYGLWDRYAELYPRQDLVYTVGVSDYTQDWFFAQVTRRDSKDTYRPTTWQIIFPDLQSLVPSTNYTLRIALASATVSQLQVRFNDPELSIPHFSTAEIGRDNAIARHGIHGLYWLFNVDVPSDWLRLGNNTIYLTQSKCRTPFEGIMYDYIRLEGPS